MSPKLGIISIIIISKVIIMYFRSVFSQSGILSLWHFTLRHFVCMAFYTQAFGPHGILHSGILSAWHFALRHFVTQEFFPQSMFSQKTC